MAKKTREVCPKAYVREFLKRIAWMREHSKFNTQELMAERLGVTRDKYAKWETRSLMPHCVLAAFSEASGFDMWLILTGQNKGSGTPPGPEGNVQRAA